MDDDIIGRHSAADLVLIEGSDQRNVLFRLRIQKVQDHVPLLPAEVAEHRHRIVRFHPGYDLDCSADVKFRQKGRGLLLVVQIGEYIREDLRVQHTAELFPLHLPKLREYRSNVVFVVFFQLIPQSQRRRGAADNGEHFLRMLIERRTCRFRRFHHTKNLPACANAQIWRSLPLNLDAKNPSPVSRRYSEAHSVAARVWEKQGDGIKHCSRGAQHGPRQTYRSPIFAHDCHSRPFCSPHNIC